MARFTLSGFADEISPVLDEQLATLRTLDIRWLEPRVVDGKNIADYSVAEAKTLHRRLDAAGVGVSALGSPIGKIGIDDPFAPELDKFKNLLDLAHTLDCQAIRLFSFYTPAGKDPWAYEGAVLERMGALVEAAEGSGVTLLHENEKAIFGDVPERCVRLHNAFPGKLWATYDPSNYVQCGVDNLAAFAQLLPYIRYMHMKDSVYTAGAAKVDHGFEGVSDAHRPVGQGDGQVAYILRRLVETGYEGFLSIEPHLSANAAFGATGAEKFTIAAEALRTLLRTCGA